MKNFKLRGFFFRRQNFQNFTLVAEEAFPDFWDKSFDAEIPQKKRFNTQEFNRFLSTGVMTALSRALWRVLLNKVFWVLGHCWVDTPHIHTSEWDLQIFHSCLLSTVTVTPSDSDYVNRSASLQRFHIRIHFFQIVHILLLEEYGVSKKWVIIMDKRLDKSSASTLAETSEPSPQDRYCARGSKGGAKKWRGNREE